MFTIGITYYNEGKLLTHCIESVLSQLKPSDQILIYDDASEDRASQYFKPHPQIELIRGEANQGPAKGRNQILAETQTEWIHFHDADDSFYPDWRESVARLVSSKVQAVYTEVTSNFEDGRISNQEVLGLNLLKEKKDLLSFCLNYSMLVCAGTYQTQTVRSIGGFPDLWQSEDYAFSLEVAKKGISYELCLEPKVKTLLRTASRSKDQATVYANAAEYLLKLIPTFSSQHQREAVEVLASFASKIFQHGKKQEALKIFAKAKKIQPILFTRFSSKYQAVVKNLGFYPTEQIRKLLKQG